MLRRIVSRQTNLYLVEVYGARTRLSLQGEKGTPTDTRLTNKRAPPKRLVAEGANLRKIRVPEMYGTWRQQRNGSRGSRTSRSLLMQYH